MEERIKILEEENSKAATVSAADQSRLGKRQHLDELRHTVETHGTRLDKLEATAKNTSAGANDSNTDTDFGSEDGPPSVPRRKSTAPSVPMMGSHTVSAEGSSRKKIHTNRDRQRSSFGSNKKSRNVGPPRSHSSSMSIVQDSEEER